jgi:hypothetical protein
VAPAIGRSQGSTRAGPTSAGAQSPTGLVAVLTYQSGQPLDLSVVGNQYIRGVALQIHWSDIEPNRGAPDWSTLDALFASANLLASHFPRSILGHGRCARMRRYEHLRPAAASRACPSPG